MIAPFCSLLQCLQQQHNDTADATRTATTARAIAEAIGDTGNPR